MNNKEFWNCKNLEEKNSDERKYLDHIGDLRDISERMANMLDMIEEEEYDYINSCEEKIKRDFGEIKNKLEEVSKLVEVRLKEVKKQGGLI